jgi:hypothetical protein
LQLFALELATNPLLPMCLAMAQLPAQTTIAAANEDRDVARDYATTTIAVVRYIDSLERLVALFKLAAVFMEAGVESRTDAAAIRTEAFEQFRLDTLRALGIPLLVDDTPTQGATNHG